MKKTKPAIPMYRIVYESSSGKVELGQTFIRKAHADKVLRILKRKGKVHKASVKYMGHQLERIGR